MEKEPIVITEKDLISRPTNLVPKEGQATGSSSPIAMLKNLKETFKQIQEIIETARGMGLNINLPGLKRIQEQTQDMVENRPVPQRQQFQAFLKLLEIQYGDIKVNELIEKLKADFGDKKLSSLGKGMG